MSKKNEKIDKKNEGKEIKITDSKKLSSFKKRKKLKKIYLQE